MHLSVKTLTGKSFDFEHLHIGIVGGGFVGSATALLACDSLTCLIWDIDPSRRQPASLEWEQFLSCDIYFICVPTPANADGSVDVSIVESAVAALRRDRPSSEIVVRSTIPVGTSRRLGCHFMPEFLTERNWRNDFIATQSWIFGSPQEFPLIERIRRLANQSGKIACTEIEFCQPEEAEACKYLRNAFLATKVAFFNEAAEFCRSLTLDFDRIRALTCADPRIGHSHSFVPGPDGNFGFGGTCLVKDSKGLLSQYRLADLTGTLLFSVLERNQHDRRSALELDRSQFLSKMSLG